MAAARLLGWLYLPLLLGAGALVAGVDAAKDFCEGKQETSCDPGYKLVGGTCVNMVGNTAMCVKNADADISGNWFYPKKKDRCFLDECFCYCCKHNYYVTVFIPTSKSPPRQANNQQQLVATSGKCWCHNNVGDELRDNGVDMSRCGSKNHAIIVQNGIPPKTRKKNMNTLYNCAKFQTRSEEQKGGPPPGLPGSTALTQKQQLESCVKGQVCYTKKTMPAGKTLKNIKNLPECYCKCAEKKYHLGAWIEKTKTCTCLNSSIKNNRKTPCTASDVVLKVQGVKRKKVSCCEAAKEPKKDPPATEPKSRSQEMAGGPPPPSSSSPGKSRSQEMAGGPPPPSLPGKSRSQEMAGGPPPPSLPGPPATKPTPSKLTPGIANEPNFKEPDDIKFPDIEEYFPPFNDNFDYFFDFPPYVPMPEPYLMDLVMPPDYHSWSPAYGPFIVTIPYMLNDQPQQPQQPDWPEHPWNPWDGPMTSEFWLWPPFEPYPERVDYWLPDAFPYPGINWEPVEFSDPEPFDWLSPEFPDWGSNWSGYIPDFDPSNLISLPW